MKKVYLETYGCQMNVADSEVALSILQSAGYLQTHSIKEADVVLVNTCAVRDNAEQRVIGRLGDFSSYRKIRSDIIIGVLGCMAGHLKKELLESDYPIDVVIGPDEYRRLPELLNKAENGEQGIAVRLSRVETYDDITPLRTDGISAWISIMRGCDKFCSYCVVPYTRGRERSRSFNGILKEVENLVKQGFKEVTLLGQNVNSYRDGSNDFSDLIKAVASIDTNLRARFITSHPKDMSDRLIETIASTKNICNYIHLPIQSGSNRILELMNRTYTKEHFVSLTEKIKSAIPGASISTDIIAGFPTETEEDHRMTLDIIQEVRFDGVFTFKYSPRELTKAYRMVDDIPEEVKTERLSEIIEVQRKISLELNKRLLGSTVEVLIEGNSKKSDVDFAGRTDTNKTVVFPKNGKAVGESINVLIERVNSATLFGKPKEFN